MPDDLLTLSDDDIRTEWLQTGQAITAADDDATDTGDGTDSDDDGSDADDDASDSDADQTDS